MDEEILARRIALHLDDQVSPRVAVRLHEARSKALAATVTNNGAGTLAMRLHLGSWAVALVLLVVVAGFIQWRTTITADNEAALETQMLADEVPVKAYLDPGFKQFLAQADVPHEGTGE
jgi:hypothetical protein